MKTLLITGASRGLGKAIAEEFLSHDWHVIGTSTNGKTSINNQEFEIYSLDLAKEYSIKELSERLIKGNITLDILINSAGIHLTNLDGEPINLETLKQTLQVNLIGPIDLTERLLPLVQNGGHIINVSSGASLPSVAMPGYVPAYRISKAGVNMFTRVLADRLENIKVSAFDPGWMKTDMGGQNAPRDPKDVAKEMFKLVTSNVETGHLWYKGKIVDW